MINKDDLEKLVQREVEEALREKRLAFSRYNDNCKVWWTAPSLDSVGVLLFSFDKKKVYNLFSDFPHELTKKEIDIFVKEEPYWANFFKRKLEKISYNLPSKIMYNGQELTWEEYINVISEKKASDSISRRAGSQR